MRIWISKPFYETLPYIYLLAGLALLAASLYLNFWYWPTICLLAGLGSLIYGLFVYMKRRDFRHDKQGSSKDD